MFLERVQKICAQKGISIAQLEADIGVSRGSVYKWRKHSPSLDVACKVANYLGTSLDDLVGYDFYSSDEDMGNESLSSVPLSDGNFFGRFDELLKERGIRAADVSKATGITSSTFTDWKKGRYVPKLDKLLLIADFLGVSIDYLIGRESDVGHTSSEVKAQNISIGKRIKAKRKELGMSAEQLADVLGVSPATIYRYESNEISSIKVGRIKPMAKALNTSVAYLMGWDESFVNASDFNKNIEIYDKIQELCNSACVSITSLEAELGIGKGLIGKWRKNSPNIISLQKVADYFDVSVDYLLGRERPASSSFVFSPDEKSLILLFRELNDEGQEKARSYIDDLVASGRYIKSDQTGLLERDS